MALKLSLTDRAKLINTNIKQAYVSGCLKIMPTFINILRYICIVLIHLHILDVS